MDTATIAMSIAAITLGVTVVDKLWTGSWSLSSKIARMEKNLNMAILASKKEVEERQDEHVEFVGNALTAFRDKFREIELYVRDNYIKGSDFIVAMKQHNDLQKAYQDAIITRLDRVEKKIDNGATH
jgi:hypothetical protein